MPIPLVWCAKSSRLWVAPLVKYISRHNSISMLSEVQCHWPWSLCAPGSCTSGALRASEKELPIYVVLIKTSAIFEHPGALMLSCQLGTGTMPSLPLCSLWKQTSDRFACKIFYRRLSWKIVTWLGRLHACVLEVSVGGGSSEALWKGHCVSTWDSGSPFSIFIDPWP